MLSGVEGALALVTELFSLPPRVAPILLHADSLHERAPVARNFVKLVIVGLDAPRLEALKQAVHAQEHLVRCLCGSCVFEVDHWKTLLSPELAVGFLQVVVFLEGLADIFIDDQILIGNRDTIVWAALAEGGRLGGFTSSLFVNLRQAPIVQGRDHGACMRNRATLREVRGA